MYLQSNLGTRQGLAKHLLFIAPVLLGALVLSMLTHANLNGRMGTTNALNCNQSGCHTSPMDADAALSIEIPTAAYNTVGRCEFFLFLMRKIAAQSC